MSDEWIERNLEAIRFLRSTYRLALEELKEIKKKLKFSKNQMAVMEVSNRREAIKRTNKKRPIFPSNKRPRDDCPLCIVNGVKSVSCEACPWVVFNDECCVHAGYQKDSFNVRIERLNYWEKRLLEMRR